MLYLQNQIVLNFPDHFLHHILSRNEKIGGVNIYTLLLGDLFSGFGIYDLNFLNLITPEIYPVSIISVCKVNIYGIALYPEGAAFKIGIGATVQYIDKLKKQLIS